VRLSALRPPLLRDGCEGIKTNPGAERAAGTKNTALFDIVRFERCVGVHRTLGLSESRATVLSCPGQASVSE
jgi:hypothetical protein